jgi:hypothetical protein
VFDFHALRKSLGMHLQFMRHGDIWLTMQVYNDDTLHDLAGVAAQLPVIR